MRLDQARFNLIRPYEIGSCQKRCDQARFNPLRQGEMRSDQIAAYFAIRLLMFKPDFIDQKALQLKDYGI